MAFFKIIYLKDGRENFEVVEAQNFVDAIKIFKSLKKGVFLRVEETGEPLNIKLNKLKEILEEKFTPKKIDLEEYIGVLNQMYVMIDAGLPLLQTLSNVTKNIKNKKLKKIFTELNRDVQSGNNISNSLKKYAKELGHISISMIEVGEQTGTLAESIKDLAEILEEIFDNRRRLKKATRYPIFIIFAMIIAFTVVILFVIPPFKGIFEDLGSELPLATRFLLWLEYAIVNYGLLIVLVSVSISVIIAILYKKYSKVEIFLDKFLLKVYIVGRVLYLAMLGRFIFVFDKLVEAGIPITDSLDTSLNIVENSYLRERLSKIKLAIQEGRGLSEGFKSSDIFEDLTYDMIEAGEESGSINKMLDKISNYYRSKYIDMVDNISTLIEPILIAAIAGFVATLALGIFLPMWNLAEAMGVK
jgi:general secretion pathway protein F